MEYQVGDIVTLKKQTMGNPESGCGFQVKVSGMRTSDHDSAKTG